MQINTSVHEQTPSKKGAASFSPCSKPPQPAEGHEGWSSQTHGSCAQVLPVSIMVLGDAARARRTAQAEQGPQHLLCNSMKEPSLAGSPHHHNRCLTTSEQHPGGPGHLNTPPRLSFSLTHRGRDLSAHSPGDRHSYAWKSSNVSVKATCALSPTAPWVHHLRPPSPLPTGRSPAGAQTPTPATAILLSYLCPVLSSAVLAYCLLSWGTAGTCCGCVCLQPCLLHGFRLVV